MEKIQTKLKREIARRKQAEKNLRGFIEKYQQLEEQFRQAQKMEAMGQFATGIIHDFNNVIGVVLGYSNLLLQKLPKEGALGRRVKAIRSVAKKAAQLTTQLLAYSRHRLFQPQAIDLNVHLRELTQMIQRMMAENIEIITIFTESNTSMLIDPNCLEQVMMNLVINARDAMPSGGKLVLETDTEELDSKYVSEHEGIVPGFYVTLSVKDTGCGMSKEVLDRIFDPFFTTKEEGKGTGLGLSTVFGIVHQSKGHIAVSSEIGKGTTFKLYFPHTDQKIKIKKENRDEEKVFCGKETILVVEDEDPLRNIAKEILTDLGYTVIEASDGKEALRICGDRSAKIDLIFTDVVMPKMNGLELKKHLRKLQPRIKILFTSGYESKRVMLEKTNRIHQKNFIAKPYESMDLSKKIREILDN